jgi:type IV secretion system protein TrbL
LGRHERDGNVRRHRRAPLSRRRIDSQRAMCAHVTTADEVRYVDEDEFVGHAVDDVPLPLAMKIATWVMHAVGWISDALLTRPRTSRAIIAALLSVGFVGHNLTHPAHANVLNEIETTVEGATAGWMGNALALAQLIFLALAGLVIVTNIVTYYMAFETVRGMFSVILRSLLTIGIPYVVLQLAPTTVGAVIGYAMTISNDVTGGSAPPVTPDQVWMEGVTIGWGLFQNTFNAVMSSHYLFNLGNLGNDLGFDFNQALVDLIFLVASGVLCVIMIAAFTFIAVELVMAFLQAYFCLPLGAWGLGFMATSPTSSIAMSWWRGLIQVLIRFIAVLACVSFAQNIGLQWEGDLARIVPNFNHLPAWDGNGTPPPVDIGALKTIISFALGAVALLYIVLNLPRLAESILSGAPVLTGVNAVQVAGAPAMMGAGAIAGGALSGGLGAARGAYMGYAASMGGGSAVGLAGAARGAASGFGSAAGGGAAKGWNAASRQARNVNNSIDRMRRG